MVDVPRAGVSKDAPLSDGQSRDGSALYCLSYVSTQRSNMGNAELLEILEKARIKNESLGITGLLLHRGDSFFQILEGGCDEVTALFEVIRADPRHLRVEVVTEGPVVAREYTDWRMAFIELDGQDFGAMPGFSDLLKDTPESREFLRSLSRSKKLALLFSVMK